MDIPRRKYYPGSAVPLAYNRLVTDQFELDFEVDWASLWSVANLEELQQANGKKNVGDKCARCSKPLTAIGAPAKVCCLKCEVALEAQQRNSSK